MFKSFADEKLVELYKSGEPLAFEEIYHRYSGMIKALSRTYFLIGGDSDDLQQEGFLGLLYAVNNYSKEKGSQFKSFAYTCVKSKMLNAVNKEKAEKFKALNDSVPLTSFEQTPSCGEISKFSPETFIIDNEDLNEIILKIKAQLSSLEEKVFELYLDGLSYVEIAKKLSKSEKSIDNALQRIKEKSRIIRR